jgi:hypothetical protein
MLESINFARISQHIITSNSKLSYLNSFDYEIVPPHPFSKNDHIVPIPDESLTKILNNMRHTTTGWRI